mmetsp:Transcript_6181/g.11169  ORF Transcript_6181/g.11169 Transcript_6181/m.11169 type:complete len:214 (-) Transcript_6181:52-693(-)
MRGVTKGCTRRRHLLISSLNSLKSILPLLSLSTSCSRRGRSMASSKSSTTAISFSTLTSPLRSSLPPIAMKAATVSLSSLVDAISFARLTTTRNSSTSISPLPSLSTSAIMLNTSASVGSCPNVFNTALSSLESMVPLRSRSNVRNADLASSISLAVSASVSFCLIPSSSERPFGTYNATASPHTEQLQWLQMTPSCVVCGRSGYSAGVWQMV